MIYISQKALYNILKGDFTPYFPVQFMGYIITTGIFRLMGPKE